MAASLPVDSGESLGSGRRRDGEGGGAGEGRGGRGVHGRRGVQRGRAGRLGDPKVAGSIPGLEVCL